MTLKKWALDGGSVLSLGCALAFLNDVDTVFFCIELPREIRCEVETPPRVTIAAPFAGKV